jgi:hypothetical protein
MIKIQGDIWLGTWIQAHPILFLLLALWSLFWAGLGLWHAAKRGHVLWFFIFLVIHTFGILEMIYLIGVLKLTYRALFNNKKDLT